jgi:hypothetical protein
MNSVVVKTPETGTALLVAGMALRVETSPLLAEFVAVPLPVAVAGVGVGEVPYG